MEILNMPMHYQAKIDFSAAHRSIFSSPAQSLHGHNYTVLLRYQCHDETQALQPVLQQQILTWINSHLDHALLIEEADSSLLQFAKESAQKYFVVKSPYHTKAAQLVKLIYDHLQTLFTLPHCALVDVELVVNNHLRVLYRE